jgi:hypothetical protein
MIEIINNLYFECFICHKECKLSYMGDMSSIYRFICNTKNCCFRGFDFYLDMLGSLLLKINNSYIDITFYNKENPSIEISDANGTIHYPYSINGFQLFDALFNHCHSNYERQEYLKNYLLLQ